MPKSKYKYFVGNDDELLNFKRFDNDLEIDEPDFIKNKSSVTSEPYVLKIRNTTGSDISNVKVFGANQNLLADGIGGAPPNYGNNDGITITMGTEDITYPDLLMQSQTRPFTVGLTYLFCTRFSQLQEPYYIQYKDANGNIARVTQAPLFDPYQNVNRVIAINEVYPIAGDSMMVINQILANTTLRLYIYPTQIINITKQLAGINPSQQYGNPDIIKSQKITLSKKAILALKK